MFLKIFSISVFSFKLFDYNNHFTFFNLFFRTSKPVVQILPTKSKNVEKYESIKSLFDFQDKYSVKAEQEQKNVKTEAGAQGLFDSHTKSSLPAESEKITPFVNNPSSYLEQRRGKCSWTNPNNKRSYIPETNDECKPNISKSKRFARDLGTNLSRGSEPFKKQQLPVENDSVCHDSFDMLSKSFLPATNKRQSLEMKTSSCLEKPSSSDAYKKTPNLPGFKEDSDLSTEDRSFVRNKGSSLVQTQQHSQKNESELQHLFDLPTKIPMTFASESERMNTNRSSYSEQARIESGWNKRYNIEPNSFKHNSVGNSKVFNEDTSEQRGLMGKSTSWNRNDQFYDQEGDRWRQEKQRSAAGSKCIPNQEALSRNQALDGTKYTENIFSDGRTNSRDFADLFDSRVLSSQKEMEGNAYGLDGRESGQNRPSRKSMSALASDWQASRNSNRDARSSHYYRDLNLSEPSRKRLSDMTGSTHDAKRTHDRESNHDVFRQDLYRSSDRRSADHNFSDDFTRRSDYNYNRVRGQDFSSSFQRRSDFLRESRPREQFGEDDTGLYHRRMESESDRLWTREIKSSYDQRF